MSPIGSVKSGRAKQIQREAGVVQGVEITRPSTFDEAYLRQNLEAGVFATNITLAAPEAAKGTSPDNWSFVSIAAAIEEWHELADRYSGRLLLPARTIDDLTGARANGGLAVIFGVQGAGQWLDSGLTLLSTIARLGVRVVGLAYQHRNPFCDGSGEPSDGGLSKLGLKFVREMNRLGMVIDLSHMGRRSSLDAIEASHHPVIFSHSNADSLHSTRRNVADEQIDAIAANGGVIGVVSSGLLLRPHDLLPATLADVVRHIDYFVQRVGPDHVCLGLNYANRRRQEDLDIHNRLYAHEMGGTMSVSNVHASGLGGPGDLEDLVTGLLELGYDEAAVAGILANNLLRVFGAVWKESSGDPQRCSS